MKPGQFIINGVDSESIKTKIQSRPVIETPRRRISFKQGFGQNGSLPYDEKAYNNTQLSLYLYTEGGDASVNRETIFGLFNSSSYLDLTMYFDDKKIYKVMLAEPIKFESRYYMNGGVSCEVILTVKPYKYMVSSPPVLLNSNGSLVNVHGEYSQPLITITGSGDVTLNINGNTFHVKGVSGTMVLDSITGNAYKMSGSVMQNLNSQVYSRTYPVLKPGTNTISWIGSVSQLKIEPRWRKLV